MLPVVENQERALWDLFYKDPNPIVRLYSHNLIISQRSHLLIHHNRGVRISVSEFEAKGLKHSVRNSHRLSGVFFSPFLPFSHDLPAHDIYSFFYFCLIFKILLKVLSILRILVLFHM